MSLEIFWIVKYQRFRVEMKQPIYNRRDECKYLTYTFNNLGVNLMIFLAFRWIILKGSSEFG